MLFIQAMCDLALPDYMSDIVNDGVMGGSISIIAKYGLKMIGVTLLGTVVSVFVGYLAANVAAKVSRDMRKDMYKKVELFSNAEFDKFSTASLILRKFKICLLCLSGWCFMHRFWASAVLLRLLKTVRSFRG